VGALDRQAFGEARLEAAVDRELDVALGHGRAAASFFANAMTVGVEALGRDHAIDDAVGRAPARASASRR
jgi:hypothetical protein